MNSTNCMLQYLQYFAYTLLIWVLPWAMDPVQSVFACVEDLADAALPGTAVGDFVSWSL